MPRYFFHVYQNNRRISDREGTDCPDLGEAKSEAVVSAKELAGQAIGSSTPPSSLCVEIADEGGVTLTALTIAEVLEHPASPHFKKNC